MAVEQVSGVDADPRIGIGLIAEMAPLFPGRYFHIGGDEVSDTGWATILPSRR